ncbi:MAG: S-methyl-5-thioribose-1-phosphate isomerase [Candidatus Aenigmatarchaeota archaeon]
MEAAIRRIRDLRIQGARNVALAGIRILDRFAQKNRESGKSKFLLKMKKEALRISSVRATEPSLRNAISCILFKAAKGADVAEMKKIIHNESGAFAERMGKSAARIAELGSKKIRSGDVIFTHCHSSTVMGIFKKAKSSGKKFSVIFAETRPLFQGRITAHELSAMRIPATMIVDSAARFFMKDCDLVMMGADAITAKGAVVNKIGSSLVALAAKERKIPVYIAVDSGKMDPSTIKGAHEPIEERPGAEISGKIKGIKIRNPAFDVIPPEYVTGIITELGTISPKKVKSVMKRKFSGMF